MNISPDLGNALFELAAAFFIMNHARAVWKSKQAHGISIISTVFFALWGSWNLYFYPSVGQYLSFYAGILVMFANLFWVYSIWQIRKRYPL